MKVYAISNRKGGVGKSTTAVNLAAALGEVGKRSLLVDLDSQATITRWMKYRDDGRELYEVLVDGGRVIDAIKPTGVPGVDLIPGSSWLMAAERALAGEIGSELAVRRALEGVPEKWDFIFLDCPPAVGILTIGALAAAHGVIIPVEPAVVSLDALSQALETMERVKSRLNTVLCLRGIVACRADYRGRHTMEVIDRMRELHGEKVFRSTIRVNVRLAEAAGFREPITQYDTASNGAADYRALALEFMEGE